MTGKTKYQINILAYTVKEKYCQTMSGWRLKQFTRTDFVFPQNLSIFI